MKDDIERVRAAADLYDLVSSVVALKPSGVGTFVGLCPFHDEKTPSFNVRPAMGSWHCFGCGLGGDVFKFVEQRENIDFREAVEYLADKYHVELHYEAGTQRTAQTGSKRARLLEANEAAQRFFASQLASKEALAARKLLAGRNFTRADCERFGCGYAPRGWDNLVRHLADRGFTQQEMVDAGLARRSDHGVYDYFRGRATWPIRDSTGRTLGFGARKLYDDDTMAGKYINTPDTQLYHKNQVLYGIDMAKPAIVKKRQVVIVEGYTDVMACHLAGIDTAVATCGTAFGAEHAKIVRRLIADDSLGAVQLIGPLQVQGQSLSSRIVFTFDGDAAGQKAALHAFGLDAAFLSQTFVAVARDNLDPCDLRLQHGDEAVRSLLEHAKPLYDFVIDAAIARFDTRYTTGQMGAVKAVAPLVAQIRDRSLLDLYMRKSAGRIGVELEVMRREALAARRALQVRDEDAYAPRQRAVSMAGAQSGPSSYANDAAQRQAALRQAARNQGYYRVDDAVFMCEQQFMATLVQVPTAVDAQLFDSLEMSNFVTPVFVSLFCAVQAAGGLPSAQITQGGWLHELSKAGGVLLAPVINELSVMPLPLPSQGSALPARDDGHADNPAAPLRQPTDAERQYAFELLVRLLDVGFARRIGEERRTMAQMPDGEQKLEVLRRLTAMETARKNLQDQVYGNAIG